MPIVNENDTVATDEIRYGDNDRLAAQIAVTVGADQLVLLSDVDGLLFRQSADRPERAPYRAGRGGSRPRSRRWRAIRSRGVSKGGMKTKLMAAKTAAAGGCAMAITAGQGLRPLQAMERGAPCTWFLALDDPQTARKRWIAAMKPRGAVVVDAGAAQALRQGKSLLPAGVVQVAGSFGRGDPVEIQGPQGEVLGKGLARYTAPEARAIRGHRSGEIEALLGYPGRAALIHRDDMVV